MNANLRGYKIPHITGADMSIPQLPDPVGCSNESELSIHIGNPEIVPDNINRFISPGKQGTDYKPQPQRAPKRKFNAISAGTSADGKMVMFTGRDPGYPDNLNSLILPLKCNLCKTESNSLHSAKDHYESKTHDRNITAWLKTNYTDKNLEPPQVKRLYKKGPAGPNAFHCDICDLQLTSLLHANQHYSGRKHRLVASRVSKPSGLGYYDVEGKWVRQITNTSNDRRFGIGEQFKKLAAAVNKAFADAVQTPEVPTPDTESNAQLQLANMIPATADIVTDDLAVNDVLHCKLCGITATSTKQLEMHIQGVKHRKKLLRNTDLKQQSEEIDGSIVIDTLSPSDDKKIELADEFSMYRTPSGSFYCKPCNIGILNAPALQQHLQGRKHLRKQTEIKDSKSISNGAPKKI